MSQDGFTTQAVHLVSFLGFVLLCNVQLCKNDSKDCSATEVLVFECSIIKYHLKHTAEHLLAPQSHEER